MKVEREVPVGLAVGTYMVNKRFGGDLVREVRRRRIRRVARPRHVVLLHQLKIDFQHAHLKFLTVLTRLSMFSSLALGGTPWPRLKMCPGRPRISRRMRLVSAATTAGVVVSRKGSRLPCTPTRSGRRARTSARRTFQSTPSTWAPVATSSSQLPCVPLENTITGALPFKDPTICLIQRPDAAAK